MCDHMLSGQTQATQHAKSTGHMSFGEVWHYIDLKINTEDYL